MRTLTIAAASCLAVATACASNPAARRAILIADADRAAKEAVAAESQIDVAKIPARSLAVLPFTVSEHDTLLTPLGFGLAEFLSTDLAVSNRLVVVDRLRMDAILRELKLVDDGRDRSARRAACRAAHRRSALADRKHHPGPGGHGAAARSHHRRGRLERSRTR